MIVSPQAVDPTQVVYETVDRSQDLQVSSEQADLDNLEARPSTKIEQGCVYSGQWLGSIRHGEGVLLRPEGAKYEGQYIAGKKEGEGRFLWQKK